MPVAVAYCSSPSCEHADYFIPEKGETPQKFCTECGSPMIPDCPSCHAYRNEMKDRFCPECGKPYK